MTTTKNRKCPDCSKACTGEHCRDCAPKYRIGKPRGVADPNRTRSKGPSTRDLYPLPVPSSDTRPFTLAELDKALCTGTARDVCFPEDASSIEAKILCHGCQIKSRCLAVALVNNERSGVWAGSTVSERDSIRRKDPKRWVPTN